MKFSLAVQSLSTAFTAAVASSSLVAKKYDNRDIDAATASRAVFPSRNLFYQASTSKSSKSSPTCPPEPTPDVECGKVYTNTTVILGQNLICQGNITEADGKLSAGLRLIGEHAKLDCQGYTIMQVTESSAAALDCNKPFFNDEERLEMKQECGLFFQYGVFLEAGASMINCNVQKFYQGAGMFRGGKIVDSEFNLNRRGVQIFDSPSNTVFMVTRSAFYNNYWGIGAFNTQFANIVIIEDVIAKNDAFGLYLTGSGITVNNADIKNCEILGLFIPRVFGFVNQVTLAGDISVTNSGDGFVSGGQQLTAYVNVTGNLNSNHNRFGLLASDSFDQGSFHVSGNLNLDHNEYGLVSYSDNFTIVVGDSDYSGKSGKSGSSGSLTACNNRESDIVNYGSTFEGRDYTCTSTFNNSTGADLPVCKPCYPVCSSPSSASAASGGRSLSNVLGPSDLDLVVEDLIVAVEMDVQYYPAVLI